jgi:hypothetical protein
MYDFKMTFDEAQSRDEFIMDLAFYDVTKGLIVKTNDISEVIALQDKAFEKFNQFKIQIQHGEFTLEQLEDDVVSRNGPTSQIEGYKARTLEEHVKDFDDIEEFTSEIRESLSEEFKKIMETPMPEDWSGPSADDSVGLIILDEEEGEDGND